MESHNHPSFIEPYQGAATGVGGILRDVFTMGARPVANLNALRFGAPEHPKTRHLLAGVVAGIGGYGNCVGIPTVGGEVNFHPAYNGNILVNAMTVGLARPTASSIRPPPGVGNPVVYVGSKTGRDGIHGATMASAEFDDEDAEAKRPTVQVGDPFTEKLLIEACLELMATDAIVAIQDMGAAGLTSSSFEMASKGGVGVELDLDRVPCREDGMTPYEMMLSESQERMLMVLKPGAGGPGARHLREVGPGLRRDRPPDRHRAHGAQADGEVVGDLPIDPLAEASPEYDRPWEPTPGAGRRSKSRPDAPPGHGRRCSPAAGLRPTSARRWVWEQYDHMVMADTVAGRAATPPLVRVHGSRPGARASASTARRATAWPTPRPGGAQAVAEAWRNLTAVGATPLAVTDNMNFGNPSGRRSWASSSAASRAWARPAGPRLPGRLGQRLALQRDQRRGDPADPDHRRRRPDRRRWPRPQADLAFKAAGRGHRADRRDRRAPGRLGLSAR